MLLSGRLRWKVRLVEECARRSIKCRRSILHRECSFLASWPHQPHLRNNRTLKQHDYSCLRWERDQLLNFGKTQDACAVDCIFASLLSHGLLVDFLTSNYLVWKLVTLAKHNDALNRMFCVLFCSIDLINSCPLSNLVRRNCMIERLAEYLYGDRAILFLFQYVYSTSGWLNSSANRHILDSRAVTIQLHLTSVPSSMTYFDNLLLPSSILSMLGTPMVCVDFRAYWCSLA